VTSPGPCLRQVLETRLVRAPSSRTGPDVHDSSNPHLLDARDGVNSLQYAVNLDAVTAAPGIELSSVRRSELPSVSESAQGLDVNLTWSR